MSLSAEVQTLLAEEERVLAVVLDSLRSQQAHLFNRSRIESSRARELTAELVGARRVEDRAMLASDEAVSHALERRNQEEGKKLLRLLKKPYFARIVLEEERPDGSRREIEYKIGLAANPDCRIIDWRRAPISKLYYEYKEGDEYSEQIQGLERTGRIALRHTIEIESAELKAVTCRFGRFVRGADGVWFGADGARAATAPGQLPSVLSLITAEQFQAITEGADTTVLVQGVAGSGKTTVALHRLSWLLHESNSDCTELECLVVVLTNSLKSYIKNSLNELDINAVPVVTFPEWTARTLARVAPRFVVANDGMTEGQADASANATVRRPGSPIPSSIARLKGSLALLAACEAAAARPENSASLSGRSVTAEDILFSVLDEPLTILNFDETHLLDREIIAAARARTAENFAADQLDPADDALLLRIAQLQGFSLFDGSFGADGRRYFKHIVIDEVQDFSPAQLACVIASVEHTSQLTFVGDINQRIEGSSEFPGWEKLRKLWNFDNDVSRFLSLEVGHRSTLPIMRLADYVRRANTPSQSGRPGRVPIWFRGRSESLAIEAAINWLTMALERYPTALTAVLCRDESEARMTLSVLRPTFGASVRLGDSTSFSFEAGIVVAAIHEIKGLEFMNVVLWNPTGNLGTDSEDLARNLLYVAITRAQENLCIVNWGRPSTFLPSFQSPLVRAVPLQGDEEQE